jgi:hypothetical protein
MNHRTAGIALIGFALALYVISLISYTAHPNYSSPSTLGISEILIWVVGLAGVGYLMIAEGYTRRPPNP